MLELEEKYKNLSTLLEAIKQLNSDIELKPVLENTLQVMCSVVKAEAGTLWLLDEANQEIKAEVANGPAAEEIVKIRLKQGEGIVGRVIETCRSEFVKDVTQDSNWAKRVDGESGFVTRSIITVPLRLGTVTIGAMQVLNKRGEKADLFTEEDLWLAETVASQAAMAINNSKMYDELQRFSKSSIKSLVLALDARDPYTAGHSERVSQYSLWIAESMGLNQTEGRELELAALLHDIGKIAVPDQILRKPSHLSNDEFETMKLHPENALKILTGIEPRHTMAIATEVARYHHEKFDGSGYPKRLAKDEIPLYSRIVAVADAFDAMTTDRPYSKGRTFKEATLELIRCKGSHFDPEIVDLFAELMQERDFLIDNRERTALQ